MNPNFPPAITEEEFQRLLILARSGACTCARNQLIDGLMRTAAGIARKCAKRYRSKQKDDAISVAFVKLVEIVDRLIARPATGLEKHYLMMTIRGSVLRFLKISHIIRQPHFRNKTAKTVRWKCPQCFSLDSAPLRSHGAMDWGKTSMWLKDMTNVATAQNLMGDANIDFKIELDELIDICAENDDEKKILRLLMDGEDIKDIAVILKTYPAKIRNMREIIRSRFERMFN
jgi:DNA-directed RNA polymerase specialized sigma subunit